MPRKTGGNNINKDRSDDPAKRSFYPSDPNALGQDKFASLLMAAETHQSMEDVLITPDVRGGLAHLSSMAHRTADLSYMPRGKETHLVANRDLLADPDPTPKAVNLQEEVPTFPISRLHVPDIPRNYPFPSLGALAAFPGAGPADMVLPGPVRRLTFLDSEFLHAHSHKEKENQFIDEEIRKVEVRFAS